MNGLKFDFLVITIISLGITFVLFRYLNAFASGKAKLLGTSIKYGGSLVGFVLVFQILLHGYSSIVVPSPTPTIVVSPPETPIYISGEWNIVLITNDQNKRSGTASIRQEPGSARFEIVGEVEKKADTSSTVNFFSVVGILKERRIIFLYENDQREIGIALGTIQENEPNSFAIYYYDIMSSDINQDPQGRVILSRRPSLDPPN